MDGWKNLIFLGAIALVVSSCASQDRKQRQTLREKASTSNKFYCEYINAEKYTDTDVVLNIAMADKCETSLPFSVTQFRTASDIPGVLYCCSLKGREVLISKPKGTRSSDMSSNEVANETVAPKAKTKAKAKSSSSGSVDINSESLPSNSEEALATTTDEKSSGSSASP